MWVHTDGRDTPKFDNNGYVSAPDNKWTLIKDLSKFLDAAQRNNILVTLVLWSGATMPKPGVLGLLTVDSKLNSYINKVLVPMVRALKHKV